MHESVKDGIAQGGVSDDAVPFLDGDLAGDERRAQVVAVVHDFEEVAALLFGQSGQSPVVEDEQVDSGVGGEDPAVPSVGFGDRELFEEPWGADVACFVTFPARLVCERAGEVALPYAGGSDDDAVLVCAYPLATGQG